MKEPNGTDQEVRERSRVRSGIKGVSLIIVVAVVAILIAGFSYVWWVVDSTEHEMREDLLTRTTLIAKALNSDIVKSFSGSEHDLENPEYHRLKEQLSILKQANKDIRFIYLIGRKPDGKIFFFIDSEPADSPDYSAPGHLYIGASAALKDALKNWRNVVISPENDQWGSYLSGIAPVRDLLTGEPIAALGVDISVPNWNDKLIIAALPGAITTILLIVVVFIYTLLFRRRNRLKSGSANWLNYLEPTLAAVLGIILSLFIAWSIQEDEHDQWHDLFSQMASGASELVTNIIDTLQFKELEGLAGLFESSEDVTKEEFETFSRYLMKNSVIKMWGWAEAVPESEKANFEKKILQQASKSAIWHADSKGANTKVPPQNIYYPVLFLVNNDDNNYAVGLELGQDAQRRAAIEIATKTRLPTATGVVTLILDSKGNNGISIIRPVFDSKNKTQLRGFVLAAVRLNELLGYDRRKYNMLKMTVSLLHDNAPPEVLISFGERSKKSQYSVLTRPIFAFGKVFTVTVHPGSTFMKAYPAWKGFIAFLFGLLLTSAIVIIVILTAKRRATLENLVSDRTAKLGESEKRFNLLGEHSRTVFWECDNEGIYTYTSPAIKNVFGYDPDELVGQKKIYDICSETEKESLKKQVTLLLEKGEPVNNFISPFKTKNGKDVIVLSHAIPLFDAEDNFAGFSGSSYDVTEREQLDAELKRSQAAAEDANHAKSEFLANMSHEIRTPINGVIGAANLLGETELKDEQQEYVDIINSSGKLLLGVVNGLLDFSQIEAGKIKLFNAEFNLRSMLHNLACNLSIAAHDKNIELICSVPPNAPVLLYGDELRLQQIIINLASNAIKFTDTGEVVVKTEVENDTAETVSFRFSVRDTGIGIAKDQQEMLCTAFFQADSSPKRRHGGTGLGLSISKRLIELMGGKLDFSSELGHGSEFFFTLSFRKQPDSHEEGLLVPPELLHAKALVIDHNETILKELMERLALRSLRPIGVTDIPAAEKLIKQAQKDGDPFKLILVDMHLTGLGKDANPLAELAKSGVCMVALLPFGELFKADELKANGFMAVLTKPFRRKDFWKILQAAVSEKAPETGSATPKTIANLQSVLKDTNEKTSTSPIVKNAEILLVEDNLINQKIVLAILKKMDIQADIAVNGKIALDMLSQKTYRLVLMDIQMPVMDGFEATEKIRDPNTPVKDHQIPIIAMTAHAIDGYRDSCIKAGMNDYIAKPVTPQQMREKLELWLRKDLET